MEKIKRKEKKKYKALLIGGVSFGILTCAFLLYWTLPNWMVQKKVVVEVGESCPKLSRFLKYDNKNARFSTQSDSTRVFDELGEYKIGIRIWGRNITTVVCVKDTIAPEVTTKNVVICAIPGNEETNSVEPRDFIEEIKDKTMTTVQFKKKPDCETEGINPVVLIVQDEGDNVTEVEATVEVVYDHEPPQITGVQKLTMTVNGNISYKKGVTVIDNFDEDVELKVDTSKVDTSKVGTYPVIYTATDSSGNVASVSTTLQVKSATVQAQTNQDVASVADEILSGIITSSMSQYEKAKKIYWWCHDKIAYSDSTPDESYEAAAYRGLVKRRGDCYTYMATAQYLLTRAGIKNMAIERIPSGNTMHYWNLIDIGEGWHHFDTCRRADGATFFYKTDAEIKAYSDANKGSHNYDASRYPEIS